MSDPKTLRDHMREYREEKEARYEEYEVLLRNAMAAGEKARAHGYKYPEPAYGAVWVSLDDGRTSFARFMRAKHPGMFQYRNRQNGSCWLLNIDDYRDAMLYAIAFRNVLAEHDITVTIHGRPIERDI